MQVERNGRNYWTSLTIPAYITGIKTTSYDSYDALNTY